MTDYKLQQRAFRELTLPKFYAKGTQVIYREPDGTERELPNSATSTRRQRRAEIEKIRYGHNKQYRMDNLTNHQRSVFNRKAREQAKAND